MKASDSDENIPRTREDVSWFEQDEEIECVGEPTAARVECEGVFAFVNVDTLPLVKIEAKTTTTYTKKAFQ